MEVSYMDAAYVREPPPPKQPSKIQDPYILGI